MKLLEDTDIIFRNIPYTKVPKMGDFFDGLQLDILGDESKTNLELVLANREINSFFLFPSEGEVKYLNIEKIDSKKYKCSFKEMLGMSCLKIFQKQNPKYIMYLFGRIPKQEIDRKIK